MKKNSVLFVLSLAFTLTLNAAEKPFIFGSIPDPHYGDHAALSNVSKAEKKKTEIFSEMHKAGCELVLITGDWASGHWEQKNWVKQYGKDSKERILNIGDKVYTHLKGVLDQNNLKLIICPGDHEYGDNPWPVKSERAIEFPYYRQALANAFFLDEKGKSKYSGYIGTVPQRPIGTQYENTSIATIEKNVLFISLDIFHYEKADSALSDQGAIAAELAPDQAKWFEDVLIAAKKIPAIQFVIVQAHCPIKMPVFYHGSSGLTITKGSHSNLWNLLTKYEVDVYVGGEVHAVTVSKDPISNTVEFVHGLSTYGIWTASDKKLKIQLYDNNAKERGCLGEMNIDKAGAKKLVTANGAMSPISQSDLMVHYSMDEVNDAVIKNSGMGYNGQFQGTAENIKLADGIIGKCGLFNSIDSSLVSNDSKEDIGSEKQDSGIALFPRSISLWVNSTATDGALGVFGNSLKAGLNLFLENGKLNVGSKSKGSIILEKVKVNDGKWHFITATYKEISDGNVDLKVYVDGAVQEECVGKKMAALDYKRTRVMMGGDRVETTKFDYYYKTEGQKIEKTIKKSDFLTGKLDDFGAWYGDLSAVQVRALYNAAMQAKLKYNALQLNNLFRAFNERASCTINGKNWSWTSGLKGNPGDVLILKNSIYILLDDNGNGMLSNLK